MELILEGNLGTTRFVKTNVVSEEGLRLAVKSFHTIFTITSLKHELPDAPIKKLEPKMVGGFHAEPTHSPEVRRAAVELARKKEDLVSARSALPL
eukprot:1181403-Prorocentrum_minimum.AAC.6